MLARSLFTLDGRVVRAGGDGRVGGVGAGGTHCYGERSVEGDVRARVLRPVLCSWRAENAQNLQHARMNLSAFLWCLLKLEMG